MNTNFNTDSVGIEKNEPPKGWRVLWGLIRNYPKLLWMIFLLGFLSSLVAAPTPFLGKIIIDEFVFSGSSSATGIKTGLFGVSTTVWMILLIVLLGVGLKLLSSLLGGWQCHYILQITRNALFEVRLKTAALLMGARQEYLDRIEPGRIASRLSHDINQMDATIFMVLRNLLTSVFTIVVVLGFMLFLNVWLTLVVLITMPITAALSVHFYSRLHNFNLQESERVADLNTTVTETFAALPVIRVFTSEIFFLGRLRDSSEALRFAGIHHWTRFHAANLLLILLSGLGADVFLLFGGISAIQGTVSFGEFFAFYGYQAMLWGPIGTLLNSAQTIHIGAASAEKLVEISKTPQEPFLNERAFSVEQGSFRGEIIARDLSFAYANGERVLWNLNFTLRSGTMTALVGQSGSGKTTLASLLLGLYLPEEGELLIDGVDIRMWDLHFLRSHVGAVLQDSVLINDTVRTNLCLGAKYTDREIWAALAAAHLDNFVRELPNGLDQRLGVNGVRLSGGQRQRLAIARVFLKDPTLLILDEATSALDSETEKAIQRSFDALMAGRTSVVIAHRLSTIHQADQIIVLHQGRLVESGTHAELVTRNEGHYRQLYEAQVEGMIPVSGATRRPWVQVSK